jgi:hypothetical protein
VSHRLGAGYEVVGVAAVAGDTRDVGGRLAGEELAAAAAIAMAAVAAVPADTGPLAFGPSGNAGTQGIHHAHHFMSRHARVLDARPMAFLG